MVGLCHFCAFTFSCVVIRAVEFCQFMVGLGRFVAIFQSTICWVFDRKINTFSLSESKKKAQGRTQCFFHGVLLCPFSVQKICHEIFLLLFLLSTHFVIAFPFNLLLPLCFLICPEFESWKSTNIKPLICWLQTSQQSGPALRYSCWRWQPVIRLCPSCF